MATGEHNGQGERKDLSTRIAHAVMVNRWDPRHPLEKIGRFEGLGILGTGSYGVVYKVRDPELERDVALKLCKTSSLGRTETVTHEARVLAKLSHPNIITIHEIGEHEGRVFLVMELVDGVSGRDLVNARPCWEEAVDFYRDAGRGLAAAHTAGVVHGDFKPSNTLRNGGGRARVVDFGLARVRKTGSGDPGRPGTLSYMAPEVLRGEAGGPLADQWAFCVALWETLEGERPFDGSTVEVLLANISGRRKNVNTTGVLPSRLRVALNKGLSINPRKRYASMEDLLDELDQLRVSEEAKPPSRRLRGAGGVVLFSMITICGGTLGGLGVAVVMDERPEAEIQQQEIQREIQLDPIERVRLEVLAMVEAGELEAADQLWERQQGGERVLVEYGTATVSRAFLNKAHELAEAQSDERALIAAQSASKWALDLMADTSDRSSAASTIYVEAIDLTRRLASR